MSEKAVKTMEKLTDTKKVRNIFRFDWSSSKSQYVVRTLDRYGYGGEIKETSLDEWQIQNAGLKIINFILDKLPEYVFIETEEVVKLKKSIGGQYVREIE